jgi:hypothetical protein
MCLFTLTVNAQDSTTTEASKDMEFYIDKYGPDVKEGFNNMVASVTPIAENGFKMVVRLQIAEGIFYLLISLIFTLTAIRVSKKWEKILDRDLEVPIGIGVSVVYILLPFLLYWGIMLVSVPEWYAIKEIISLLN